MADFVYSPSEFRSKLRSALEFAKSGATVVIDRYGERYEVRYMDGISPYVPAELVETPQVLEEKTVNPGYPEKSGATAPTRSSIKVCKKHGVEEDICKLMKH